MGDPARSPAIAAIIAAREEWRRRLISGYKPTADRLQAAYERTLTRLQPYANALTEELLRKASVGEMVTAVDVRGMSQWAQLLMQIEIETAAFARLADSEASQAADGAVATGALQARQLALFTLPEDLRGAIGAAWVQPDPEALRRLVGYVDSPAMQAKVDKFGENAARQFADVTLSGFAQGKHPVTMARAISNWLNVPYAWAENTTRTTYLYSYRMANQATYAANSSIVQGWLWWSSRDSGTCLSCWSQHGRIYPVTEGLNDHHGGRCTPVPVVVGADWIGEMMSGPDEFALLSEAEQREILKSPQLFELYQQGKLPWGDLSKPYQNDVFGEMLRAATVGEVTRAAR